MEGLCGPGPDTPKSREAPAQLDANGLDGAQRRAFCGRVKQRTLAQAHLCAAVVDCRCVRASTGLRKQRSADMLPRRGVLAKDGSRSTHSRRGVCVARTFEQAPARANSTALRTRCGANRASTDSACLMRSARGTSLRARKPPTSPPLEKHRTAADA
jgi:hypothetical protein